MYSQVPLSPYNIINSFVTPEMFGAKGDGIHDDLPAFQRAMAFFDYKGIAGLIKCSSKTYLLSDTLDFDVTPTQCVGIQGAIPLTAYTFPARSGTRLLWNNAVANGINFGAQTGLMLKSLYLDGASLVTNGLNLVGAHLVDDCFIVGFNTGFRSINGINSTLVRNSTFFANSLYGIHISGPLGTIAKFENCRIRENCDPVTGAGYGVYLEDGGNVLQFTNCVVESNHGPGMVLSSSAGGVVRHTLLDNVWFENNNRNNAVLPYEFMVSGGGGILTSHTLARNCHFGISDGKRGILCLSCEDTTFENPYLICANPADNGNQIVLFADAARTIFKNRNGAQTAQAIEAQGLDTIDENKGAGNINFRNLQDFANDAAAGIGGLVAGDLYEVTGSDPKQLAIKL